MPSLWYSSYHNRAGGPANRDPELGLLSTSTKTEDPGSVISYWDRLEPVSQEVQKVQDPIPKSPQ